MVHQSTRFARETRERTRALDERTRQIDEGTRLGCERTRDLRRNPSGQLAAGGCEFGRIAKALWVEVARLSEFGPRLHTNPSSMRRTILNAP